MKYVSYLKNLQTELMEKINRLEQEDMLTSKDIFYLTDSSEDKLNPYAFLYHGIRFDSNLKKLESIFKEKKILSGKHINGYYNYSDNANKGEYVSMCLYSEERNSGFNVFIEENISLLISPKCNAILTKYVDFNTWEKIKDKNTKNLYSYIQGEFWIKDFVSFEFIRAIGVPYQYLLLDKGKYYADDIIIKIQQLMKKYEIDIPMVDTNSSNKIILPKQAKIKGV